jgi:hypothetical protein
MHKERKMTESNDKDQRQSSRLIEQIDIRVKKLTYPLPEGDGELASAKNIGKQGICFESGTAYEMETLLCLKIHWFGWQRHKKSLLSVLDEDSISAPLSVIAEVVWCRPGRSSGRFETGVRFRDVYEDDYKAFLNHIESLAP